MPEALNRRIAFIDLDAQRRRLGDRVDQNLSKVLEHGQFIMGPEVWELEERLADRAGVDHAIACSSGTDALILPLLAWGIGPGDAVFVPAFTFTATAEVVALLGATPVFCDVEPDTYNLSPESLRQAVQTVTSRGELRSRAVIPVDLFGQPASYPQIEKIAADHSLLVLADAAQSFGADLSGTPVGRFGHATATSFFPAKPLGCFGDGGAVFTADPRLAEIMRSLRVHGKGTDKYDTVRIGLNARLDTIQAAVLLAKLEIFDEELGLRGTVSERYSGGLADGVTTPSIAQDASSTWSQYTICLESRAQVVEELGAASIPTAVYYPRPLHKQPAFTGALLSPTGCEVSSILTKKVLSLPMHPYLSPNDQDYIIDMINSCAEPFSG